MTTKSILNELRTKGVQTVFGRPLWRCTKDELLSALHRLVPGSDIPHISNSQINTYLRCGRQWMYRYIHGVVAPPSGSMSFGSSVHSAIEQNLSQKIYSGNDLPEDTLEGLFEEDIKGRRDGTKWDEDLPYELALSAGAVLVKEHHKHIAPKIQPAEVETSKRFSLPGVGTDVLVKIDLVEQNGTVVDHKTSKTAWNQAKADDFFQLSLYAAYYIVNGAESINTRIDTMINNKNPYVKQWESVRDKSHAVWAMSVALHVVENIKRGVFQLPEPGAWACSPKYCGYWEMCHKDMADKLVLPAMNEYVNLTDLTTTN